MQKQRMRNQKGFTLVEIAIVLVIVGLLIGGIIKGQDMIKSSKVTKAGKQIETMATAVNAYVTKKGYNPATAQALVDEGFLTATTMKNPYNGTVSITISGENITITSDTIPAPVATTDANYPTAGNILQDKFNFTVTTAGVASYAL